VDIAPVGVTVDPFVGEVMLIDGSTPASPPPELLPESPPPPLLLPEPPPVLPPELLLLHAIWPLPSAHTSAPAAPTAKNP
jgi:hypothetical protein